MAARPAGDDLHPVHRRTAARAARHADARGGFAAGQAADGGVHRIRHAVCARAGGRPRRAERPRRRAAQGIRRPDEGRGILERRRASSVSTRAMRRRRTRCSKRSPTRRRSWSPRSSRRSSRAPPVRDRRMRPFRFLPGSVNPSGSEYPLEDGTMAKDKDIDFGKRADDCALHGATTTTIAREVWAKMEQYWRKRAAGATKHRWFRPGGAGRAGSLSGPRTNSLPRGTSVPRALKAREKGPYGHGTAK